MFIALPGVMRQKIRGEGKEWRDTLQRGKLKAPLAWTQGREAVLHSSRPWLDARVSWGQAGTALEWLTT